MRCPTLAELPPPPPGRTGWPWTEGGTPASDPGPGHRWPSITVVVPSFQQGAFLEETLRSILLQGYPELEVLVMDAGSKDQTVDVIRRYERWIAGWVSEPDGGQSAAINKGWRRSTGELVTWLNSDDLLLPGWAARTAGLLTREPATEAVYCDVQVIDEQSRPLWVYPGRVPTVDEIVLSWKTPFAQQGFLVRRNVLDRCGYLDETLHFTMDTEYWLRLLLHGCRFQHAGGTLGAFRVHEAAKTATNHHVHVANLISVVTAFFENAPPEMADLARRARQRLYWNAAHAKYDGRQHAEARAFALRHLADGGWRVLPRVSGMVGLSLLGAPGHRLLGLVRRIRARGSWS
jgi:glycosyltransferase involved in cell wall biosynthesis